MNFEEIPTKELPINGEQEESSVVESNINNNEDDIKNAVLKMQELFIKSAEQYLDKESDKYLKEQIIKFYSDENRLKTELTNVFSDMSGDDIFKKIEETSKAIESKDDFIKYVETKNFATSAEERALEEERIRNVYESRDEKQLEAVRNEISEINSQGVEKNSKLESKWKGTEFWSKEIEAAGVMKKLKFFNDVVTEKRPPHPASGYGQPVLTNIILDGKKVDIYHSDQDKKDTTHRVFLHIKE